MSHELLGRRLGRRPLLGAGGALIAGLALTSGRHLPWLAPAAAAQDGADELTLDLPSEPPTLDPALVYDVDGWSLVHSVYDALLQFGPDGRLEPLLAESASWPNPLTYELRLRQGVMFHNGEPFDARSVSFSVAHLTDPDNGSQVGALFRVIERVEEVEPHLVRLRLADPAPWLPAQMAVWLAMLPPIYAADPANDFAARPVGTGPYRFVDWERGSRIALEANAEADPGYFGGAIKGEPIAPRVAFRFVPEAGTRVADLRAGTASLIRDVPFDQAPTIEEAGAAAVAQPVAGSAWVRLPTDVAPFADVRVRQALNHAVDVDAIVAALLGGNGARLGGFAPAGTLNFDPDLPPYAYDPARARALLTEAGYPDGFATRLDYASSERADVVEALAGMLAEVGIDVETRPVEKASFNLPDAWTGKDPDAAPLRFVTWRFVDPYSLLDLLISDRGFLSRHANPTAQPLIDAAATEPDEATRIETYHRLGQVLRDEPAAIYLYGLTSLYGVAAPAQAWTPRPDDYIIPTARR